MKKILLIALLFVSAFANGQNIKNDGEPYEVYCAFHGEWLLNGRFKPKSFVWGEEKNEVKLTDEKGKKLEFKNLADVANYLAKRGWKMRDCESFSTSIFMVFVKTIRNDSEAKEGLYFDTEFQKN